jgi:mono/diheme cytochrome c family protein
MPTGSNELYQTYCAACHGQQGEGTNIAVALNTPDVRSRDHATLVQTISEGVPGTAMPAWQRVLEPQQIDELATYLQNWGGTEARQAAQNPTTPTPINQDDPQAMLAAGEHLFSTTCASCHGENGSGGLGPVINSQQFLARHDNERIRQAVLYGGWRPNSQMPAFGDHLTQTQVEALVDYIRAWEPTAPMVEDPRGTAIAEAGGRMGQGMGQGRGQGPGMGQGMGQGRGQGPGMGQGQDRGQGPGRGQGQGMGQMMPGAGMNRSQAENATQVTYTGTVEEVTGSLLTFRTDDGASHQVMLGPPWYWSDEGIALNPGDRIELEGFEMPGFYLGLNWLRNTTTGEEYVLHTPEGAPAFLTPTPE